MYCAQDGDGKLTITELARCFRALGLEKRSGEKMAIDKATFDSFDTNKDGFCTPQELEANLFDKTRKKIEEKLDSGCVAESRCVHLGARSLLLLVRLPVTTVAHGGP